MLSKQTRNLVYILFWPPHVHLNHDALRVRQAAQSEINSWQFGACFATNPASINSDNRWTRHYRSALFSSFPCGTQRHQGEIAFTS